MIKNFLCLFCFFFPRLGNGSVSMNRYYSPLYYYSFVFGILELYDLPDIMAAIAMTDSLLILVGPRY